MNLSNGLQWQYDHCEKDQQQQKTSKIIEKEKNSNFNSSNQITANIKIFNSVKAKQLGKINCQQQQQQHQKFLSSSSVCQIQMNNNDNDNNNVMSMKHKNYLYNVLSVNCVNINDNKRLNCIFENNNKIKSTYHNGGVFFIYIFVIFLVCGNQLNFVNCLNNEQQQQQQQRQHDRHDDVGHDQFQHRRQALNENIKFLLNNNNNTTRVFNNISIYNTLDKSDNKIFNDSILTYQQQRNHNSDNITDSNEFEIQNVVKLLNTNHNPLLSENSSNDNNNNNDNDSKNYLKNVANIVNTYDDNDDRNESVSDSDNDINTGNDANINAFSELLSYDFNKDLSNIISNNSVNDNIYFNGGSYENYSNLKNITDYYDESFSSLQQYQQQQNHHNRTPIYLNEFAVHIPYGKDVADIIASKYGFTNMGQIGSLKDYYLFHHHRVSKRSLRKSDPHHKALESEDEVLWVQQQHEKIRKKRDYVRTDLRFPSITQQQQQQQNIFGSQIGTTGLLRNIAPQTRLHYRDAGSHNIFPDPLFKEQWYLNGGAKDGLDMNVGPAWQKGYTGKGVVVSILDDGIQTNHPDLAQNYDPDASYDINGNDSDPMPQDNGDNKHGTRCAGEVAAVAFNNYCGVGVAYNASIGGVRMLDGSVNDAVEAKALSLNPQHIDIYSASWGPEDDGSTVDGPGPLARRAFIYGVTSGRQGKGSIFVWASGNGGRYTDSCNCDGYTNSIFTLSISSATQGGFKPWYLEECSSTLATTYSSGTPGHDKSVATVDMDGRLRPDHICTVEHTGTSASAPLAAGICALALEANPSLTWRDMQYLVVMTSRPEPLEKEMGWILNGVKRKYSHKFGYGLMDAGAMVSLAEQWTTVPPQHICKSRENNEDRQIEGTYGYTLQTHMDVNGCAGTINEVRYLEHVQCKITLRFFPRGNLRILLTSPMGTTSTLLFERPRDIVKSNFDDWPFLSVHFWGEKAEGRWTLQVINGGRRRVNQPGILSKWQLIFYGTQINPIRLKGDVQDISSLRRLQGLNPFVFPTDSDLGQPTGSFYNNDPYSGYLNYQNLFTGAGSNPEKSIATVDGHNIPTPQRQNVMADSNNKLVLHDCDPECDSQGCYGRGPTQCVACKHYRLDNTCVSRCPPRSFPNQGGVCWPCHESCETCAGAGQDSCLTCAPAHLHVTDLAVCLQICPDGYYENYDNKTCVPCEANCASCQDKPDYCTSCDHHLVMHDHKCYSACPIHTYETEDYNCASCHPTCATCNGSSESQCITCRSGRFALDGKCLNNCPDGYYGDKKRQECVVCPTGCSTCSSNGFCLTCKENWTKNKKGKCIANGSDNCDESEYYDNGHCHSCHSTCETCVGPTETDCLTCPPSLLLQNNRCVNACDDGYYMEAGVCAKCLHTCTQCVSRMNCTACAKGLQLQSGECRTTCADGYYSDRGTCAKCYLSCHTCSGPRRDQCVQCPKGWQLAGGECHPECPEGFYKSEFGCQKCHHYCKTCNGAGPLACTSCPPHFMLDGGLCMECLGSQYYDVPTQTCKTCHESCRSCSGPGQYSCQTCAFPLNLDRLNNQCVPCCPSTDTPPDDQSCCHCDKDTGGCINASPAGKRRIAVGAEQQLQFGGGNNPDPNIEPSSGSVLSRVGSPLTTITAVAVAGCLLIITIFAVIFAVLQRNSYTTTKGFNRRTHTGVKYNKLSTKSKERSSTTLQINLNEHEDNNFEYDDDNDDDDEDYGNSKNGFEQEAVEHEEEEDEETENNNDIVNGDGLECTKNISFYVDYSKNKRGNKKIKNVTVDGYKTTHHNLSENLQPRAQRKKQVETLNTRQKASNMSIAATATHKSLSMKNCGNYDVCLSMSPSPSSKTSKITNPRNNSTYKRMKTNDCCIEEEEELIVKSENIKGSVTTTTVGNESNVVTGYHHSPSSGTVKHENILSCDDGQHNNDEIVVIDDYHLRHNHQRPTTTTHNQNLINYNNMSDDLHTFQPQT